MRRRRPLRRGTTVPRRIVKGKRLAPSPTPSRPVLSLGSDPRIIAPALPVAEIRSQWDWAAMTVQPRRSTCSGLASARPQRQDESRHGCPECDRRTELALPPAPSSSNPIQHHTSRSPSPCTCVDPSRQARSGPPPARTWLWRAQGSPLTSALSLKTAVGGQITSRGDHPPLAQLLDSARRVLVPRATTASNAQTKI